MGDQEVSVVGLVGTPLLIESHRCLYLYVKNDDGARQTQILILCRRCFYRAV